MAGFLYGTLILFLANLFNRFLAFFYQIVVIRLVGAEGIGLLNMVYPLYCLFLVFSTAGIPVAVSRLVAYYGAGSPTVENYILRLALKTVSLLSIFFTFLLFALSPIIKDHFLANPAALPSLYVLALSIIIVAVSSVFRGYFQGRQNMIPSAVGQTIEQIVRIAVGIAASLFFKHNLGAASAGLAAGVTAGETAGLLVCLLFFYFQRSSPTATPPTALVSQLKQEMFTLAWPITIDRVVSNLLYTVDAAIIPARLLASGMTVTRSTEIFGQLNGIAIPLIFFPTTVTTALATAIIPALSHAQSISPTVVRYRSEESLRLTLLVAFPAMAIFALFPYQITGLLFHCPEAGTLLQILALGGFFLYLDHTAAAILQGLGRPLIPLLTMVASSAVKIGLLYYLTSWPGWSVKGIAWAINAEFLLESLLNLISVARCCGLTLSVHSTLFKPAAATAVMAMGAAACHYLFGLAGTVPPSLKLLAALAVAVLLYTWLLFRWKIVPPSLFTDLLEPLKRLLPGK